MSSVVSVWGGVNVAEVDILKIKARRPNLNVANGFCQKKKKKREDPFSDGFH